MCIFMHIPLIQTGISCVHVCTLDVSVNNCNGSNSIDCMHKMFDIVQYESFCRGYMEKLPVVHWIILFYNVYYASERRLETAAVCYNTSLCCFLLPLIIPQESLEFFNIPEAQSENCFLMDRRRNIIHYSKVMPRNNLCRSLVFQRLRVCFCNCFIVNATVSLDDL